MTMPLARALLFFAALLPVALRAESIAAALAAAPVGTWIDYRVPLLDAQQSPCCYGSYRKVEMHRGCTLDGRDYSIGDEADKLEPDARLGAVLRVFLRRGREGVDRVRAYGADCPVEPGDATVRKLESAEPAESVALLQSIALERSPAPREEAFAALAHHDGAVPILRALVESGQPREIRRQALFWLGQVGDEQAFEVFDELLAEPVSRR